MKFPRILKKILITKNILYWRGWAVYNRYITQLISNISATFHWPSSEHCDLNRKLFRRLLKYSQNISNLACNIPIEESPNTLNIIFLSFRRFGHSSNVVAAISRIFVQFPRVLDDILFWVCRYVHRSFKNLKLRSILDACVEVKYLLSEKKNYRNNKYYKRTNCAYNYEPFSPYKIFDYFKPWPVYISVSFTVFFFPSNNLVCTVLFHLTYFFQEIQDFWCVPTRIITLCTQYINLMI